MSCRRSTAAGWAWWAVTLLATTSCPSASGAALADAGASACSTVHARIAHCRGRVAAASWRALTNETVCGYLELRCREATTCESFNECLDGASD